MGLIMHLPVIALSLFLGLQAASAEEGTATAAQQLNTQTVKCRPRMCRRTVRYQPDTSCSAKIDAPPPQVLVEAVLVVVRLNKDHLDSGVDFALLDGASKTPVADASGVKFGSVGRSRDGFIRALKAFGETTVLAAPRMLVLDKQSSEIHLGDQLGYRTSTVTQTSTIETVKFINLGTQLRVRPFVLSDGTIRLEVHAERSTGKLDGLGIPQLNAVQFATNVMLRDGVTIAMGGPIETEVTQGEKVSPFLSSIPYLGCLLCNTENVTTEKQLIMLLTAHVQKPDASGK
jgi:type II secretory pathway component GspD/PulD (secretin)